MDVEVVFCVMYDDVIGRYRHNIQHDKFTTLEDFRARYPHSRICEMLGADPRMDAFFVILRDAEGSISYYIEESPDEYDAAARLNYKVAETHLLRDIEYDGDVTIRLNRFFMARGGCYPHVITLSRQLTKPADIAPSVGFVASFARRIKEIWPKARGAE